MGGEKGIQEKPEGSEISYCKEASVFVYLLIPSFFLPSIPHPGMARAPVVALDHENMATSDGWQCGEPEGTRIPADGVQLPISISLF